jgi:hypothetical protein
MKKALIIPLFILTYVVGNTQITTGNISGTVHLKNDSNNIISIRLYNLSNNYYQDFFLQRAGNYQFNNLIPGGSYQLTFTSPFTDTLILNDIEVLLGKNIQLDVTLNNAINTLLPVKINSSIKGKSQENNGYFTLTSSALDNIPLSSREYSSLFAAVPQAYIKDPSTGAVSFSGQNNRYNSLYIDGALQNDIFGLSASGTYGGQTNSGPLAFETIEQLQVQLTPYDASLGGYTGAAINITTKSGKNKPYSSVYQYNKFHEQFYNQTGLTLSGPIRYNRTFYYFNTEYQQSDWVKPFDFNTYKGNLLNEGQLKSFINSVKNNYAYDPGTLTAFQLNKGSKFTLRIDHHINKKNRVTFNLKKGISEKMMSTESTPQFLFFNNNGRKYSSNFQTVSIEINSLITPQINNQFNLSYSQSTDKNDMLGIPFPSVGILDGEGFIFLGSNTDAIQNSTQQLNINLRDKLIIHKGNQIVSAGVDVELNTTQNYFLQNTFGSYFYYSPIDFLRGIKPVDYTINYYLGLHKNSVVYSPTKNVTKLIKCAFYVNDQININKRLKVQTGIRITTETLIGNAQKDSMTAQEVLPAIQQYYNLSNTQYGENPSIKLSISPRINIQYAIPKKNLRIEFGTGLFGGRMPIAWLAGIYSNNGIVYGSFEPSDIQRKIIRFNPSALNQWKPEQFGQTGQKGVLNLIADKIAMPSVWRSSLLIHKKWKRNWSVQADLMYYFNNDEIDFSNVNILPAVTSMKGPDNRLVYSTNNQGKIPVLPDSSNPYDHIILMKNNANQHGFGYRYGIQIKKTGTSSNFSIQYNYGEAYSIYDGNYTTLLSQWRLNEQVHGRNDIRLARSDFSPGHSIFFTAKNEWGLNKKSKLIISVVYKGASGNSFSYVYDKNSVNRDDVSSTGYDLLYVPTSEELQQQIFIPLVTKSNYYSGEEQRQALEWVLQNNPYLRNCRGRHTERNGIRLPFTHQFDIKMIVTRNYKIHNRKYNLSISIDLINAGNLLNPKWGQYDYVPGGRIKLIHFADFLGKQELTPTYNFDPAMVDPTKKWGHHGIFTDLGREWGLQLGVRLNFY